MTRSQTAPFADADDGAHYDGQVQSYLNCAGGHATATNRVPRWPARPAVNRRLPRMKPPLRKKPHSKRSALPTSDGGAGRRGKFTLLWGLRGTPPPSRTMTAE